MTPREHVSYAKAWLPSRRDQLNTNLSQPGLAEQVSVQAQLAIAHALVAIADHLTGETPEPAAPAPGSNPYATYDVAQPGVDYYEKGPDK